MKLPTYKNKDVCIEYCRFSPSIKHRWNFDLFLIQQLLYQTGWKIPFVKKASIVTLPFELTLRNVNRVFSGKHGRIIGNTTSSQGRSRNDITSLQTIISHVSYDQLYSIYSVEDFNIEDIHMYMGESFQYFLNSGLT